MQILIVSNDVELSGFWRVAHGIGEQLKRAGHEIVYLDEITEAKSDPYKLKHFLIRNNPDYMITVNDIWKLEWLKHVPDKPKWIMYCPIEGENIPHEITYENKKINVTEILHLPEYLIAYNKFGYNEIAKIRVPDAYIDHGYDSNTFFFDQELKIDAKTLEPSIVVGYVGLNIPRKGIDTLVCSWNKISEAIQIRYRGKPKLLLHTMNTTLSPPVHELIAGRISREDVILSNKRITDNELHELYHTIDFFISLHNAEGFGLPIIEAMACGCHCIVNNYAGPSSIVETMSDNNYSRCTPIGSGPAAIDVNIPWTRRYPDINSITFPFELGIDTSFTYDPRTPWKNKRFNSFIEKVVSAYSWNNIGDKWINFISHLPVIDYDLRSVPL